MWETWKIDCLQSNNNVELNTFLLRTEKHA